MKQLGFLQNKQILVLGLGATGLSCARFLTKQGLAFVINDSRQNPPGKQQLSKLKPQVQLITGRWDATAIAKADLIIASPGVDVNLPEIQQPRKAGSELIGDVELYCQVLQQQTSATKLIAVTGSNGKSTVVSLLAHMAGSCNINAELAGNIGVPVLDIVDQHFDFVILELSSFQLETMHSLKAQAATVLNISDDHLDRHNTLEHYSAIKHTIYNNAKVQVFNRQQLIAQPQEIAANAISFGLDAAENGHFGIANINGKRFLCFADLPLIECDNLPLVGRHNQENCLAALALGYASGWPLAAMAQALGSFEGLEHRCKQVPSSDGIVWVNDSKATNIGATIAAIEGLANAQQQLILIAGGDGKGADFNELKPVLNQRVDQLITLGQDGAEIGTLKAGSIAVNNLDEAVSVARSLAKTNDIVLLSPACASIDMFENYMQRGELFMTAVREAS